MGCAIAKIHSQNLLHGDLTTSNILVSRHGVTDNNSIYLIDFGLSVISNLVEDKAVDLFVLGRSSLTSEKAFICSHPDYEAEFQSIIDGYVKSVANGEEVLRRLDKVRARGRKKIAFG